jgi:hypothetical protein
MEPACALTRLLPRIEPRDNALVIGSSAEPAAYLLAAHDATVTFIACDLGCVERVESRMASEALASLFEGYVAHLGACLPSFLDFVDELDVVVIDPGALIEFSPSVRAELLEDLQRRSRPAGVHVILGTCKGLAPESLRNFYPGWALDPDPKRRRKGTGSRRPDELVLAKPPCPPDTAVISIAASL